MLRNKLYKAVNLVKVLQDKATQLLVEIKKEVNVPVGKKEKTQLELDTFNRKLVNERLDAVKSFYDEFVGIPIVDFKTFSAEIPDYKSIIQGKLITDVYRQDSKVVILLSSINNPSPKFSNKIIVQPSLTAELAEVSGDEKELSHSLYRIGFMGGDYIEYLDQKFTNNAIFCI
jgi:hypothetical protein